MNKIINKFKSTKSEEVILAVYENKRFIEHIFCATLKDRKKAIKLYTDYSEYGNCYSIKDFLFKTCRKNSLIGKFERIPDSKIGNTPIEIFRFKKTIPDVPVEDKVFRIPGRLVKAFKIDPTKLEEIFYSYGENDLDLILKNNDIKEPENLKPVCLKKIRDNFNGEFKADKSLYSNLSRIIKKDVDDFKESTIDFTKGSILCCCEDDEDLFGNL